MMNIKLTIVCLASIVSASSNAQSLCDRLLAFAAANANTDSLCCVLEKEYVSHIQRSCPEHIEHFSIDRNNVMVLPMISFVSMSTFDQNSSIYDCAVIDSIVLAELDNRLLLKRLINFPPFDCDVFGVPYFPSYKSSESKTIHRWVNDRKMRHSIKRILREEPDLILFNPILGGDNRHWFTGIHDFMYLKEGKIYLYKTSENKTYDLDEYAHMIYDKTGSLKFWEQ